MSRCGDRPCAECHGQTGLKPCLRRSRRTDVGTDRDVHPDITRNARKHRTEDEANGWNDAKENRHKHRNSNADDGDGPILTAKIGLCAFLNSRGDFLHFFIASRGAQHLAAGYKTVHDGK